MPVVTSKRAMQVPLSSGVTSYTLGEHSIAHIDGKSLGQPWEVRDSATGIWGDCNPVGQSEFYTRHFLMPKASLSKLFLKYSEYCTPCWKVMLSHLKM